MKFCLKLFLSFTWPGDVPQFLIEPTSSIVQQGTSISLSCTAEPVGVKIKWLINGSVVTSQWHHGVDIGDGYLRIASFSKPDNISHEGTYQCLATTLSGTIVSREAKLEMAGKVEIAPVQDVCFEYKLHRLLTIASIASSWWGRNRSSFIYLIRYTFGK